ncbi:ATP-binding protein [Lacinutrix sp. MedPE-SW]|uniref:sensor histidine kinase n=1 Tax=Lacinutrix sp. MedPE-SW TaxID=1860087 RepID=UPI0009248A73|nr:ATP-binding protein [Lacinutrix sp. MedPE-SW]OIQ20337.1 MAG: PAS domain-containing sensor histidine kinase [Lacinutrix sp. MedPE-SW]
MSQDQVEILQRALKREKAARKAAEKILEEKSRELYFTSQKLEQLLDEKSSQLQGVFENIIDAYVVMDLQGNIIKFNEAATKLFGFDIERESVNVINLIYKEDYEYAITSFMQLQSNGYFKDYEARVYTKSKEVKWVHINASVIFDKDKNPVAAQGIVRDITEFKNLEIQKEKLLSKLEKSNDELQEYAHIVSHDLKSPLRSIHALVSWLKEDNINSLDKASLKNIELIELTLEKMEQLITDVLNYSSVGSDTSLREEIDLNGLVSQLVSILYVPENIEIKSLNILPNITGDKTKLQQLFQNLISNAIKFIDKEKGTIIIDVEDVNSHYKFSIKDNGIGIEKQFHEKIFKIFHSLKKSKDSTGIGLSIVKKIVNLHEGEIWLDSEPNVGTTFYFTLKK